MYKKMIFGCLLSLLGFFAAAGFFAYAALNPWFYDNIDSELLASFLGNHMLAPFIISIVVMLIGLAICFAEAYLKKEDG